jgi:RNA polymerase sigma-70 factor (ECF subfamily)
MSDDSSETHRLVRLAASGDRDVRGELLLRYRERLMRMIAVRLDTRLQGRIDPLDVVQEAYLEASAHLDEYLASPSMPFFLWLRAITAHKLLSIHRQHLGTEMRDAAREVSLLSVRQPAVNSDSLAEALIDRGPRPSEAAMRAELLLRLRDALDALAPLDREVLTLRHFEQLTTAEIAAVLEIGERAASKRYLRALERLRTVLAQQGIDLREVLP